MDRLKVSSVVPSDYKIPRKYNGGTKRAPSEPLAEDGDLTQDKIDSMPASALADEWLRTVPGTDASRDLLQRLNETLWPSDKDSRERGMVAAGGTDSPALLIGAT